MKVEQSGDLGLTASDLAGDLNLRHAFCRGESDRADQLGPRIGNDLIGSLRDGAKISHSSTIASTINGLVARDVRVR